MNNDQLNILMIEDNECDIDIISNIFEKSRYPIALSIARSAEEALDFLYKEKTNKMPTIIFLDLHLPLMSGFEFLDTINECDNLRMIPVIIMSTSDNQLDIMNAYQKCISCYLTKPMDIDEFEHMVLDVSYLWLSIAKLPIGKNERPEKNKNTPSRR